MGVARFIKAGIFPEEIPRKLFKRIECHCYENVKEIAAREEPVREALRANPRLLEYCLNDRKL